LLVQPVLPHDSGVDIRRRLAFPGETWLAVLVAREECARCGGNDVRLRVLVPVAGRVASRVAVAAGKHPHEFP
jgi:hypothetical protein